MSIQDELSAVVKARKDTLIALRGRIGELLEPIPAGVTLRDEAGEVGKIVRLCTGASQWGNQTWDVTIKGRGMIDANGKLVYEDLDDSKWDGNNMHYRKTEPTCLYREPTATNDWDEHGDALSWATGKATRAIAARLPEAIARYMAECEAEAAANEATLVA